MGLYMGWATHQKYLHTNIGIPGTYNLNTSDRSGTDIGLQMMSQPTFTTLRKILNELTKIFSFFPPTVG